MMSGKKYNPDNDVPSLEGKTIFITGGTGGIGKETIIQLAKHSPSHIFFTGRNRTAAQSIITTSSTPSTTVTFLPCDPHSLASVRATAAEFLSQATRLDIFIANLGTHSEKATITKDGYEVHFGLNHLHNTAFLKAFLPLMLGTAQKPNSDVRFISLTSQGTGLHPRQGIDYTSVRNYHAFDWSLPMGGSWARYGQSKLANVLMAKELARRYPQITSLAIHPGVVETAFVKDMSLFNKTVTRTSQVLKGGTIQPHEGAHNSCWVATSPEVRRRLEEDTAAAWFEPVGIVAKGTAKCHDENLAKELWDWTMKELETKL